MAKFGEFNSARLKPTWESKTKAGNDATGWKRGQRGFGGDWSDGERAFMKTANPKADREFFGPTTNQGRRDGAMRVMTNAADPGTMKNDGDKGYRGVDE
jgi:hypothetical protein